MKRFCKLFACWVFVLLLVFSPSMQSHASLEYLLIQTDSNALMTLELDDNDYKVMAPRSSIGSVVNTVNMENVRAAFYYRNFATGASYTEIKEPTSITDNGARFVSKALDGFYLANQQFYLKSQIRDALPPSGKYIMSFDWSNNFAPDFSNKFILISKETDNAAKQEKTYSLDNFVDESSGELYCSGVILDLRRVSTFQFVSNLVDPNQQRITNYDGVLSVRFVPTDESANYTIGFDVTSQEYQSEVSSSLSDLSSSVDEVSDEIGFVAEAIQNLQGAMEPHYNNVLTQLHHITEQLHAFYDQVYNNIHLPELSMLTQIKEAIENIDLQIEVDISEVKTAINNMSTAVQNKLQSTTDQITGGYDNSEITQENEKLEQSINQYDEVESGIFEDAEGFIGDFEYPSVDSLPLGIIKALAFVGSFLQGVFICMGEFSVIITFSLTMIFVMVVVGYHRIRS